MTKFTVTKKRADEVRIDKLPTGAPFYFGGLHYMKSIYGTHDSSSIYGVRLNDQTLHFFNNNMLVTPLKEINIEVVE